MKPLEYAVRMPTLQNLPNNHLTQTQKSPAFPFRTTKPLSPYQPHPNHSPVRHTRTPPKTRPPPSRGIANLGSAWSTSSSLRKQVISFNSKKAINRRWTQIDQNHTTIKVKTCIQHLLGFICVHPIYLRLRAVCS